MQENEVYQLTRDKAAKLYINTCLAPKVKELEDSINSMIDEFEDANECGVRAKLADDSLRMKLSVSQPYALASEKLIEIISVA